AAVREVEVEQQAADPQGAIDRAIATLDRAARGDDQPAHYTESEVDLDEDDEPMQAPPARNGNGHNGRANGSGRSMGTDLVISRGERAVPFEQERERPSKAPRPAKEFANPRRAQAARAF